MPSKLSSYIPISGICDNCSLCRLQDRRREGVLLGIVLQMIAQNRVTSNQYRVATRHWRDYCNEASCSLAISVYECDEREARGFSIAHDDAPTPRLLTAHMAWISRDHQLSLEGQIRNCSPHTPKLPSTRSQSARIPLTSHIPKTAIMSLQPPSLAVRSKSPSRAGGATKAVILVCTFQGLYTKYEMLTRNARSADPLAARGSGLCLWICPR
jgi:hypothetical protein